MKAGYLVHFTGKDFENVDAGMRPNAKRLKSWFVQIWFDDVENGKLVVMIDDQSFRGDYYEITAIDDDGMNASKPQTNQRLVNALVWRLIQKIFIMRLMNQKMTFDARLESYEDDSDDGKA